MYLKVKAKIKYINCVDDILKMQEYKDYCKAYKVLKCPECNTPYVQEVLLRPEGLTEAGHWYHSTSKGAFSVLDKKALHIRKYNTFSTVREALQYLKQRYGVKK